MTLKSKRVERAQTCLAAQAVSPPITFDPHGIYLARVEQMLREQVRERWEGENSGLYDLFTQAAQKALDQFKIPKLASRYVRWMVEGVAAKKPEQVRTFLNLQISLDIAATKVAMSWENCQIATLYNSGASSIEIAALLGRKPGFVNSTMRKFRGFAHGATVLIGQREYEVLRQDIEDKRLLQRVPGTNRRTFTEAVTGFVTGLAERNRIPFNDRDEWLSDAVMADLLGAAVPAGVEEYLSWIPLHLRAILADDDFAFLRAIVLSYLFHAPQATSPAISWQNRRIATLYNGGALPAEIASLLGMNVASISMSLSQLRHPEVGGAALIVQRDYQILRQAIEADGLLVRATDDGRRALAEAVRVFVDGLAASQRIALREGDDWFSDAMMADLLARAIPAGKQEYLSWIPAPLTSILADDDWSFLRAIVLSRLFPPDRHQDQPSPALRDAPAESPSGPTDPARLAPEDARFQLERQLKLDYLAQRPEWKNIFSQFGHGWRVGIIADREGLAYSKVTWVLDVLCSSLDLGHTRPERWRAMYRWGLAGPLAEGLVDTIRQILEDPGNSSQAKRPVMDAAVAGAISEQQIAARTETQCRMSGGYLAVGTVIAYIRSIDQLLKQLADATKYPDYIHYKVTFWLAAAMLAAYPPAVSASHHGIPEAA